jgi:serine/threonine-protein kinase HipA
MDRRLFVHLDHGGFRGPVGRLWMRARRGQQSAVFRYEPEWLEHPGRFALDPELELQSEPLHTRPHRALFGAFDDGTPDRWGRNLVLRAEVRAAQAAGRPRRFLAEADYLLGVDDETRQGAIRYSEEPAGPFLAPAGASGIPPLLELPRLRRAASRLGAGIEDDDDLALLLAPGSSLGGARPKTSVRDRDGRLSLAKFPGEQDSWNNPAWEAVALSLARRAGITAADARIERAAGKDVLVVRRFDRTSDRRIPFVSAMTMLGAADREQRSYEEIAEAIRREGAAPTADLEELWRRIVFTVLISNRDDHLRNHGFLRLGDGGWRLSPAYDLNPTPAEFGGRMLTTAIVEGDPSASLELAFETAAYYGIRPPRAREIASEVVAVIGRWRDEANGRGIPRREQGLMASAFEHAELERAARG